MVLSETFREALGIAYDLHKEQTRKGGHVPYISHLLGTASIVLEAGGTEEEAIGALFHDAGEDQGGIQTVERIRQQFGDVVADIVTQCSDSLDEKKPDWRTRKKTYCASIPTKSRSAQLVTLADKIYNARAIIEDHQVEGDTLFQRFSGDKADIIWYYQELDRAFAKLQGFESLRARFHMLADRLKDL